MFIKNLCVFNLFLNFNSICYSFYPGERKFRLNKNNIFKSNKVEIPNGKMGNIEFEQHSFETIVQVFVTKETETEPREYEMAFCKGFRKKGTVIYWLLV